VRTAAATDGFSPAGIAVPATSDSIASGALSASVRPLRAAKPKVAGVEPSAQANPVAPAQRSAAAEAKARRQHDEHGRPYLSYQGLLDHLATLTRNELRFHGTPATVPVLTDPTSRQKEAFDLIGAAIPPALKK